jgi:toxin ParE1/3/4
VFRQVILTPEAKSEAREAYDWYEEQDRGLGDEFLRCLELAFRQVAQNPQQYPVRFDSFRRILIRRFPYAIYFEDNETKIYVYSIFHCSQNPVKLTRKLRKT